MNATNKKHASDDKKSVRSSFTLSTGNNNNNIRRRATPLIDTQPTTARPAHAADASVFTRSHPARARAPISRTASTSFVTQSISFTIVAVASRNS